MDKLEILKRLYAISVSGDTRKQIEQILNINKNVVTATMKGLYEELTEAQKEEYLYYVAMFDK